MAATPLPWTEVNDLGTLPAAEVTGDTVNGHVANNDGKVEIIVRNTDASSHNVTFVFSTSTSVDGVALPGRVVAVAAGVSRKFYGFPVASYGPILNITVDSALLKLSAEHKVGVSN